MKSIKLKAGRKNEMAMALRSAIFSRRVVKSKKVYNRKKGNSYAS